ncbi:MAG: polysaccharide biosynthesis protein [Bacteroidaceae bacterium]|nr:polysaccharide biosynthesis protein [Bacteroidaceae bacterium]
MRWLSSLTKWYFSKKALPYWGLLLFDCIIVLFSGYVVYFLHLDGLSFLGKLWPMTYRLLFLMPFFVLFFRLFHTYSGIVRYSSFIDLQHVVYANFCAAVTSYLVNYFVDKTDFCSIIPFTLSESIGLFIVATMFMAAIRVCVKSLYDLFRQDSSTKRVFIYGVHAGGVSLAKSIQNQNPLQYKVVGFVTPDESLYSQYLMGALVRHDSPRLVGHMKEKGAEILIVSPLQVEHFRSRDELINDLLANDIKIMMMPQAEEWDGTTDLRHQQLHEVDIEDLLPRNKIDVDMEAIGKLLTGKVILITGAAGSIGSEMVRQISIYNPSEMVLIDQAETPMHDVRLMMMRKFPNINALTIVTSITDQKHMEKIFADHRPDYVLHAAAYKHVPMMEDNPGQAVHNNIYGTRVIADLAVKYGTKKFVMISTDKAVNPTNVMGCSKRICEIYCQSLNKAIQEGSCPIAVAEGVEKPVTQFVTTRFGNVLGSNGSVIPIFKEQIKKGGPITVTHPDIIRFFMLIPEACKLVLEAGTMGKGGEIFVFDMGKPVRIVDLAKRMIKLSGAKNVDIKFTGLRDGEKLYEEVLSDKENTKPTVHPKIMIASVREYDYNTACANEARLIEAAEQFDDMNIVKIMKEIVPEYKSNSSKYCVLDKEE